MKVNIAQTQAVFNKLFGADSWAESVRKLDRNPDHLRYSDTDDGSTHHPVGVFVAEVPNSMLGSTDISIGVKGSEFLRFTLSYYPACCGIYMLHDFRVQEGHITQEQLDELLSAFFNENKFRQSPPAATALGRSNRIEVVMVEHRDLASADPMQEVEPIENPNIIYKPLWNFFHKHARKVRTRLQVNANTGNILHNMEVLF